MIQEHCRFVMMALALLGKRQEILTLLGLTRALAKQLCLSKIYGESIYLSVCVCLYMYIHNHMYHAV